MVKGFRATIMIASIVMTRIATAQSSTDAAGWTADLASRYSIFPDLHFLPSGDDARLDLFVPRSAGPSGRVPAVIFFHGGGWTGGDKLVATLRLLPYLELGWAAINVNYRLGPAPLAVEDSRCALSWVIRNADKYHLDVDRLVVSGESAGSHLALITAMATADAGFDTACPEPAGLRVAAVVNWYGVTDVGDVVDGPNAQQYARRWIGDGGERMTLAKRVSPLTYVRPGLPPVITVHGNADQVAPYRQAVRFHQVLEEAKVPNRLVTIEGGGHGGFSSEDFRRSFRAIRDFLAKHVVRRSVR